MPHLPSHSRQSTASVTPSAAAGGLVNFTPVANQPGVFEFTDRARPLVAGDFVEAVRISVFYDIGGMDFLAGAEAPRAIWLSVRNVKLNHNSQSVGLFDGVKTRFELVKRLNRGHVALLASRIDALAPALALLWRSRPELCASAATRAASAALQGPVCLDVIAPELKVAGIQA